MENSKVAILTDTHFGIKKGSKLFHDYFEKFYSEVFFPTLDERKIDTVIHLGDLYDVRKGIDYWSLNWSKRVFFDELLSRNITTYVTVGNHDIFYRTNTDINSPELLVSEEYSNVNVYSKPITLTIKGVNVFLIPWICEGNADEFVAELYNTSAKQTKLAMGHLELSGFLANQNYTCDDGMDSIVFAGFDKVFSGHFHKKNTIGNVTYLGNTYQLYWADEGDSRGFHIFDMKTQELEFIENPNILYKKIQYKDGIVPEPTNARYIKLIGDVKNNSQKFSDFVDTLYVNGAYDIKVIENTTVSLDDVDIDIETEDTITSIKHCVDALDNSYNKDGIMKIMRSIYTESLGV